MFLYFLNIIFYLPGIFKKYIYILVKKLRTFVFKYYELAYKNLCAHIICDTDYMISISIFYTQYTKYKVVRWGYTPSRACTQIITMSCTHTHVYIYIYIYFVYKYFLKHYLPALSSTFTSSTTTSSLLFWNFWYLKAFLIFLFFFY